MEDRIAAAARLLREAEAVLVMTGAGMGADCGFATFRGSNAKALWRNEAGEDLLLKHGTSYRELADPDAFAERPDVAWGFHAFCERRYREVSPHAGYELLARRLVGDRPHFVVTSNVDGHHARHTAGERLIELHGNCHFLQCSNTGRARDCLRMWPVREEELPACDPATGLALSLATCPDCGLLARPNVCFFSDLYWVPDRTREQHERLTAFLDGLEAERRRVVVLEIGAGTAVSTVRNWGVRFCKRFASPFIRINLEDFDCHPDDYPAETVGIADGALSAITAIARAMDM